MINIIKAPKIRKTNSLKLIPEDIEKINKNLKIMVLACEKEKGIGIASNQIGILDSMFIIKVNNKYKMFLNPTYEKNGEDTAIEYEGCLSVPGNSILVERHKQIKANWYELVDNEFVYFEQILSGLIARVFQHEYDHLVGLSIVDKGKISLEEKSRILKKLK